MYLNNSLAQKEKTPFLENLVRWFFSFCVIVLYVFGVDIKMFRFANLTVLAFGLIVGAYILFYNKIAFGKSLALASVMFLYMHLSCFWAYDMSASISQMRTQTLTFLLFLVVYEANMLIPNLSKLYVNALYVAGFVMILYSIYVYGGLGNIINMLLSGERVGRKICLENTYGILFAQACMAALYRVLFYNKKLALIGVFIFPLFSFASGSKKAFAFVFIGLFLVLVCKYGFKKLYKTLLGIAAVVVIAYFVLQLPVFETVMLRIEEMFEGSSVSDDIRKRMIAEGWDMATNGRPFFGYGIDNFKKASNFTLYSHNNYIEVLVSFGFVGAGLYYGMYVAGFIGALRYSRHYNEYKIIMLILLITMVMEWALVSIYAKEIWVVLGMLLAANDKFKKSDLIVEKNRSLK